eukprot:scaffold23630_cov129-Isochrysis_galbana.AAC.5
MKREGLERRRRARGERYEVGRAVRVRVRPKKFQVARRHCRHDARDTAEKPGWRGPANPVWAHTRHAPPAGWGGTLRPAQG